VNRSASNHELDCCQTPPEHDAVFDLAPRVAQVRAAIVDAAARAGRSPAGVQLIAVTKTLPPAAVGAAYAAGVNEIGENYVQEAQAKRGAVAAGGRWHLIGGLQRNKVRAAVSLFDVIQTIDSAALANRVAHEAARAGRRLAVLIQVRVVADESKRGIVPGELEMLARQVASMPALRLDGLMTMGPVGRPAEDARGCFRALRELRDALQDRLRVELPHLSMGMSNDFLIAVEEGATMVRLGRALFGPRGASTGLEGS
jgi:hypothetical protein